MSRTAARPHRPPNSFAARSRRRAKPCAPPASSRIERFLIFCARTCRELGELPLPTSELGLARVRPYRLVEGGYIRLRLRGEGVLVAAPTRAPPASCRRR